LLRIVVPPREFFNEQTNEFVYLKKPTTLTLEHSLVSISKWEQKWHKSFLSTKEKTNEEAIDYIRCMTLTQNVPLIVYNCLTTDNVNAIKDYINDPATATTIRESASRGSRKIITSEQIYSWMFALQIPMECQKWHVNRLLMLIKVCEIQQNPKKTKMKMNQMLDERRALNEQRKARLHSKG